MEEKSKIISQTDLDLTEDELNKIFFGSEKPAVEPEKIKKSGRPAKLVRQEKLPEPEDEFEKAFHKEPEPEPIPELGIPPEEPHEEKTETKKPWGRPKIWTDEKILQLKAERRAEVLKRRAEKSEHYRLSKLSTQEPITKYESAKLIDRAIKTKDEIEHEVSEKRKVLKNILNKQNTNFLSHKNPCENHVYTFHSFDINGTLAICKHCSSVQHFEIKEWYKYLANHRKEI